MNPNLAAARPFAKTLLQYHLLNHAMKPADAIVCLGSNDPRVAERAAELCLQNFAPVAVFSGNVGALTEGLFARSEAEEFADVARKLGVPEERIFIEPRSTNTGENVRFSKDLLASKGIRVASLIAVQKPYMERRTLATFTKWWPEAAVLVTSPRLTYEELPLPWLDEETVINVMVGDFDRIVRYPALGYQSAQPVTEEALAAFRELVRLGFGARLVPAAAVQ